MLSEGERADRRVAAALGFFGKPVMRGTQMKGQNIHRGRRSLGIVFADFPSSILQRGGGIFVLIELRSQVSWCRCIMGTSYLQG